MNGISVFLSKIFLYIQAININAFWCVFYFLANNVFAIAGISMFVFLMYKDIQINSKNYISDNRNIY